MIAEDDCALKPTKAPKGTDQRQKRRDNSNISSDLNSNSLLLDLN